MADSSDDDVEAINSDSFISDDGEEEVMPSDVDESDEDDEDEDFEQDELHNDKHSRFKIERQKDEMASDIEDDNEEDHLPNSQAWGKNKRLFYDTDFVDKDFRSQKQKEEDLAKYEEEEALAIQKRLLESVSEKDLGLDFLIESTPKAATDEVKEDSEQEESHKVELNLSTMEKAQKVAIIKKESPELELLLSDLKKYLDEIKNELEPALNCLRRHSAASPTLGLKYLKLRYFVLLNYCTNVTFYLSLMSSPDKQHVKEHPIIKEIFMHKKLISELDVCLNKKGKQFSEEMEVLFHSLQQNSKLVFMSKAGDPEDDLSDEVVQMVASKSRVSDADEAIEEESDDENDEEGNKRAITYEMEKNKGLIPKRKREQRNPRVKYRKKFEKAAVRRKGQVREPRKELTKYGGELTGINVRAVKSVKFK